MVEPRSAHGAVPARTKNFPLTAKNPQEGEYEIRADSAFNQVMEAAPRRAGIRRAPGFTRR